MKPFINLVSILSLVVTAGAPLMYYADQLGENGLRTALVISMITWFASAWWRDRQNVAA